MTNLSIQRKETGEIIDFLWGKDVENWLDKSAFET